VNRQLNSSPLFWSDFTSPHRNWSSNFLQDWFSRCPTLFESNKQFQIFQLRDNKSDISSNVRIPFSTAIIHAMLVTNFVREAIQKVNLFEEVHLSHCRRYVGRRTWNKVFFLSRVRCLAQKLIGEGKPPLSLTAIKVAPLKWFWTSDVYFFNIPSSSCMFGFCWVGISWRGEMYATRMWCKSGLRNRQTRTPRKSRD
jgi:hypothetical protein